MGLQKNALMADIGCTDRTRSIAQRVLRAPGGFGATLARIDPETSTNRLDRARA